MSQLYKFIKFERIENIAFVKMNRPEVLNAINTEVLKELEEAISEIKADSDILAVIITGEGRAFVAGADISEMNHMSADEAKVFSNYGNKIFREIETLKMPVIAAINGFALGGGCELSMACDIRIASSKAKFGQPETGLGITPGFGGTQRLARLVGTAKAKEIIFTSGLISAEEALKIGLVNQVVQPEELENYTLEMAKIISKNGPKSIQYAKEAINTGVEIDIETGLTIEENLFSLCFATKDQEEGMNAFLEKRKPKFSNT
ncbi:MAG: enoyl-CoA hydratase/isomerase family protein [Tissierellales bacterium]|nr:enoyl-CoA hydratase/isomerase family protein [Tissierellales bacterium]MBN2826670.1 enoyl-CoA hydratase/isomerase family protein [Tissierellales bacterium]